MSTVGRDSFSGGFLVYINGVRVPATSASVSVQVDTPASASVQVPAHSILYGLGDEDHLDLAVFYLDNYYYSDATWCLLFEGRITGQGYSNSASDESMYFTAESNLNALSDLYLNFMSKGSGKITSSKSYPNQINIRGKSSRKFLSESLSGRPLARPFDLIDNIYYSVLGATTAGIESRLSKLATKSVDAIVAKKKEAMGRQFEVKAKRQLTSSGILASHTNYAEQLQIAKARLQQAWISKHNGDTTRSSIDVEIGNLLKKEAKASAQKGSPTVITGFFARYFRRIRSRNHWVCSPYLEGTPNSDNPIKAFIGGGVFPIFRASKTSRYAKSMAKQSGAKYGPGGSALALVKNIFGLYFYRITEVLGPPVYTVDKYGLPKDKFYAKADNSIGQDKDPSYYGSWASKLSTTKDRLCIASYLTHPVAPFSVPPACNAIFPSMRFSFNLNNSFKGKPTRLYYDKRSPYGRLDFSVNSASYATDPSRVTFPSVIAGAAQKAAGKATEEIDLLIFPEEYYRGPVPVKGQMHPTHMNLKKYASAARFGTIDRGDPQVAVPSIEGMSPEEAISALESVDKSYKKGISSYGLYYLLARQEYLKQKYGAVSGDVNMLFNPYLVCGFPCAVLSGDKSGLHFYGEVVSISHSLSSSSSNTSVQLGTMRSVGSMIQGITADGFDVDSYPQEPVEELRNLLQVYEPANEYYTQVFKKNEIGTLSAKDQLAQSQEYNKLIEELEGLRARLVKVSSEVSLGFGPLSVLDNDATYLLYLLEIDLKEQIAQLEANADKLKSSLGEEKVSASLSGLPAAFDFKSFLGWERKDNPTKVDYIIINKLDEERRTEPGDADRSKFAGYQRSKLVPLPETSKYFKSSAAAMKLASRPVCTLEQYIDFYYCVDIDKTISDSEGRGRGCRVGTRNNHFSGAVYYDVIRQYIGGPGMEPGTTLAAKSADLTRRLDSLKLLAGESGLSDDQRENLKKKIKILGESATLTLTGIGPNGPKTFATLSTNETLTFSDLPDSRKDWQKLLLDYLTIIEGSKPQEGEG